MDEQILSAVTDTLSKLLFCNISKETQPLLAKMSSVESHLRPLPFVTVESVDLAGEDILGFLSQVCQLVFTQTEREIMTQERVSG